jgi:hypothetical protein
MFHGWDNFYLLIGTAAAALIGLLFVVATLTAGREATTATSGQHIYMTPTVFHLALVLLVSALMLAPEIDARLIGILIGIGAVIGFVYIATIGVQLWRRKTPAPPHWSDHWCYAVAPAAIYLGLAVTALLVWRVPAIAPYSLALTVAALLLIAIRNAWDLVTWLAPRRDP